MADEKVGTFQTRRINWRAQQHQQAWESTAGEDREDSFLFMTSDPVKNTLKEEVVLLLTETTGRARAQEGYN